MKNKMAFVLSGRSDQSQDKEPLDQEWVDLMREAADYGIPKEDIRDFLSNDTCRKER